MLSTEEFNERFLELNKQGYSTTVICDLLGENRNRGYSLLRKKGLHSPQSKPTKITEEEIELITQEYLQGYTIEQLHKIHPNIKKGTINYWLRKKGVTRKNGKIAHLNNSYFHNIDTELKAYFLGLLCADGSVQYIEKKHSYMISLELKIEDKYIIEKFAEEIETDLKVKEYSGISTTTVNGNKTYNSKKHNAYLRLHSTEMAQDLISWGCTPNKTETLQSIPDIPTYLIKWFILGFYDGDGIASVGKKYKYMGFCGTKNMINSISLILYNKFNLPIRNIYYNRFNGIYYIFYGIKTGMIELYTLFYKNNDIFYMKRKKDKLYNYLKQANTEITF